MGFGATFAITQSIAAIGFPIIILLLVPVRTFLLPRYFTQEELSLLDAPTASPFTMESVGGNFGENIDPTPAGSGVEADSSAVNDAQSLDETDVAERGEVTPGNLSMKDFRRRTSFRSEGGDADGERIEMQRPVDGSASLGRRGRSRRRPRRA